MILLFNVCILAIFLLFMISGYCMGFVRKIISIISFILSVLIGWNVAGILSSHIPIFTTSNNVILDAFIIPLANQCIIFVLLSIIIYVVLMIIGHLCKIVDHLPLIGTINKIGGLLLGFIQALFVVLVIGIIVDIPYFPHGNQLREESILNYTMPLSRQCVKLLNTSMYDVFNMVDQLRKCGLQDQDITNFIGNPEGFVQNLSFEDKERFVDLIKNIDIEKINSVLNGLGQ